MAEPNNRPRARASSGQFHDHVGGRPEGVPVFDPALVGLATAQRALWAQARSETVATRYKGSKGKQA